MKNYANITNMKERKLGERGAIAFLTVIVIALILMTITLGFIRLMTKEQRQATDDELTKRAYYAAESGIEDAKRAIKAFLDDSDTYPEANLKGDSCDPAVDPSTGGSFSGSLSTDLDTEYTCQLISLRGTEYKARLFKDQSAIVPLIPATGAYTSIRISWHENKIDTPPDLGNNPAVLGVNTNLPQEPSWDGNVAMLRAEFIDFTTLTNPNELVSFFKPINGGIGSADLASGYDNSIPDGNCVPGNSREYACVMTIARGGANPTHLRLSPLYRNANVKVELLDGGNPVDMIGAQARIDVTGRAGDVYRRVQKTFDLVSTGDFADYALMADRICKRFDITNNVSDFNDNLGCNNNMGDGGSVGTVPTTGGAVAGNATIGTGTGGVTPGPVRHWRRSWPNASTYTDPNLIRGCKWEFGHNGLNVGVPASVPAPDNPVLDRSNAGAVSPCRNGDSVAHEFPVICTGPGGTYQSGDGRNYQVKLTMYYTNGTESTDIRNAYLPRHTSAQHSPLSTLPCSRGVLP